MAGFDAAVARTRAILPVAPETRDLIRCATLAPNGHNTQAWLFRPGADDIAIMPDPTRRTPVVDPDDHHVFVSLGCAAENLMLAAGALGRAGEIVFDPSADGTVLVRFGDGSGDQALFDAIPHRQSTRSDYDGSAVSASDLTLLAATSVVPGVDLVLVTDRAQVTRIGDLVIAGNTAQIGDPAFVAELKHWLRFSPAMALQTGDGLFSVASGNPALPEWIGSWLFEMVFTEKAETAKYTGQIATSAGIAGFCGAKAWTLGAGWTVLPAVCPAGHRAGAEVCFREPTGRSAQPAGRSGGARRSAGAAARHRDALRSGSCHALFRAKAGRGGHDMRVRRFGRGWLYGTVGVLLAVGAILIWARFDAGIGAARARAGQGSS